MADEAYFTVLTATPLATDAAIDVLARYRDHTDLRVRTELAQAWSRYDTELYGQEVIAHLVEDDLYFPVTNLGELQALREFGGRSHIRVAGEFTAAEFVSTCRSGPLTHLWMEADLGPSWQWLNVFPRLHEFTVETLHPHLDFGIMPRLHSLRTLRIPEGTTLAGTDHLPRSVTVVRERLSAI